MEAYEISPEILREEPHGRVYSGRYIPTNTRVLIKKVPFAPGFPQGIPCSLSREVLFFQKMREYLQSAYVIRRYNMLNRVEDARVVYYSIFEYLDTDLAAFIAASAAPLPSGLVKKLLFQLLRGVDHCHDCGIIHRNLNPRTLLLDRNGKNLKIGDAVGCSFTFVGQTSHPGTVTRYYQAPEVLLGSDDYSTPADIWAVGCIFAEMVTKDVLFVGGDDDPVEADRQQLYEIFRELGKPVFHQWPGVASSAAWNSYQEWEGPKMKAGFYMPGDLPKHLLGAAASLEQAGAELLSEMLTFDPDRRITANAALNHRYFEDMVI